MKEFKTMAQAAIEQARHTSSYTTYCDYIASIIQKNLKLNDIEKLLSSVGSVEFAEPKDGIYTTTKKIRIEDRYGKKYIVTIEEY